MQENTDGFNRPLGILGKNIANKTQEKMGPFWNKWAELFSNRLWLPMINFASKKKLSRPHTKENKWFSFSGIRTNSLQQKNHPIDETLMKRIASYVSKSEDTCKQTKTTQREPLAGHITDNPELKWVLETPYDICNQAMEDLLKAYNSTFTTGVKGFTMKYRSKKDRQQPIPITLGYDSRLVMNRLGEFYLCIPKPLELRIENQDGYTALWGNGDIGRIYRLCYFYNKLQSKKDTAHGNKYKRFRYKLKRCMLRI
ncbi:hypothetical protein RhiirA5_427134 [Rhizophagus irregularis]|uniref:Uncharacterized protein n=1 Tax=Rhizophagus irregularis TaxID=588596 RepID=A0A2N0P2X8_9GLOM|nr:hypothetical protein RhiirA5_427134 [Rhizophagus irregularis]